jgi:hypothetical protein
MLWRVIRVILGLLGASLVCGIAVVLLFIPVLYTILTGHKLEFVDSIKEFTALFLFAQLVITPSVWLGGIPCFLVLRRIRQNLLRHYARAGLIMAVPLGGIIFLSIDDGGDGFAILTFFCTLIAPVVFWWIVRPDRWEVRRGNGGL